MVADHVDGTGSRRCTSARTGPAGTAIKGALHLARERLAAEGVVYPGQGRQPLWPILAVTGRARAARRTASQDLLLG